MRIIQRLALKCNQERSIRLFYRSALPYSTLSGVCLQSRSNTSLFDRVLNSSTYLRLQYERVVILRTPPYWSVRVALCLIFNLVGNSFHCRSRTASDMTCKLGITFVDDSKDFCVEKSGQSSCRRAKRFQLAGNC